MLRAIGVADVQQRQMRPVRADDVGRQADTIGVCQRIVEFLAARGLELFQQAARVRQHAQQIKRFGIEGAAVDRVQVVDLGAHGRRPVHRGGRQPSGLEDPRQRRHLDVPREPVRRAAVATFGIERLVHVDAVDGRRHAGDQRGVRREGHGREDAGDALGVGAVAGEAPQRRHLRRPRLGVDRRFQAVDADHHDVPGGSVGEREIDGGNGRGNNRQNGNNAALSHRSRIVSKRCNSGVSRI